MSFNHYAFGAVGEWLYRYIAGVGLNEESPGYKHIIFSPHPGEGLTEAQAVHQSPYGEIRSTWKLSEGKMTYSITIPANTTATVHLPRAKIDEISENNQPLRNAEGVLKSSQEIGKVTLQIGSGSYEFSYKYI
jgi:alpha-L-rhamnosidase